jgi:hypothetical protein
MRTQRELPLFFQIAGKVSSRKEEWMPRGSGPAPPRTETPVALREMAARARKHAWGMPDEVTVARLNAFANELEARAAALEATPQTFSHEDAAAVQKAEHGGGDQST